MERLTKREGKHTVRIGNEWRRHNPVWDRLAEYEDTGLTPQEIEQMKSQMLCDKPKCKHDWVYIGLDEYRCSKCDARRYT